MVFPSPPTSQPHMESTRSRPLHDSCISEKKRTRPNPIPLHTRLEIHKSLSALFLVLLRIAFLNPPRILLHTIPYLQMQNKFYRLQCKPFVARQRDVNSFPQEANPLDCRQKQEHKIRYFLLPPKLVDRRE